MSSRQALSVTPVYLASTEAYDPTRDILELR